MKRALATLCTAALTLGVYPCRAADPIEPSSETSPAPMAAEDLFFVDHPDLKDEGEIVEEASNSLAAEGYHAKDLKEAAETLAARSRALLAERPVAEWQRKAVSLYPALGVANSEFNALFLKHYKELQASSPSFIQEPSWPVLLARRCDDELRGNIAKTAQAAPPPALGAAENRASNNNPIPPARRFRSSWESFFSVLLVTLLTLIPGAFLVRKELQKRSVKSKPEAGAERPAWEVALIPAAAVYFVSSLPAAIRTLMTNADLAFGDRVAVSLMVGMLFGACITLPFYGVEMLWHAWQKHADKHAPRPLRH